MSGLCGVIDFSGRPVAEGFLQLMAEASPYRSPDGVRSWIGGSAGFAHLALHSTAEAERENQPLVARGGELCVVADVRLDNRASLVSRLYDEPGLESSPTDVELILAAFLRWGIDCPLELVGDFAFAIWDQAERKLFCARDALGVRRIHYARSGGLLCIGSDAQQILEHPAIARRLDEEALARYLARDLNDEEGTMFLDVKRLPPAHTMVADEASLRVSRYWDIDPDRTIRTDQPEQYAALLAEALRCSVERRMRTQAPALAIEMSGGLDSGSVAALAADVSVRQPAAPGPFALSFAFDELPECDERRYSSLMQGPDGLEVEYLKLEDHWLLGDRDAYEPFLETPFMAWDAGQGRLAERAREKGARVVLSGQSGDGVVLGSLHYLADQVRSGRWIEVVRQLGQESRARSESFALLAYRGILRPLVPRWIERGLGRLSGRTAGRTAPSWMTRDFATRIGQIARGSEEDGAARFGQAAKRHQYASAVTRNGAGWWGYLYDRTMGSHGIEARHPFLDRDLVEFVLAVPSDQLYQPGTTKPLLRQAMAGLLPEPIRLRSDKTSSLPFTAFSLREREPRLVSELLREPVLAEMGLVNGGRVRDLCQDYLSGKGGDDLDMWMLVTAERWLRAHWQ